MKLGDLANQLEIMSIIFGEDLEVWVSDGDGWISQINEIKPSQTDRNELIITLRTH